MMKLPWLRADDPFLDPRTCSDNVPEVPGLIAASESLTVDQLKRAYPQGIFPWYSPGQPVLWWSPNPRMVLIPQNFKVSASLKKFIREFIHNPEYEIRVDDDFHETILSCATQQRPNQQGTWITHAIIQAYTALHQEHLAHSVEVFYKKQRIGGLYAVNIGRMIYGESMFSRQTNASKIALAALCAFCHAQDIRMIDCQQETSHLKSLGAKPIHRNDFLDYIEHATSLEAPVWIFNKEILHHWIDREQS